MSVFNFINVSLVGRNARIVTRPNEAIIPEDKLIIKTIAVNEITLIAMFNPFSQVIFKHWIKPGEGTSFTIIFTKEMPSGQYIIQYGNSENEFFLPLQFKGLISAQKWLITYSVTIDNIAGLEVRLAVPKQYFPFIMVDSFEGIPENHLLTTDVWSNWIIFDLQNFQEKSEKVMIGYRSWITNNYMVFSADCFTKPDLYSKEEINNFGLEKYLESELGLEVQDKYILDFATRITAKSFLGVVYQIIKSVLSHVSYKVQPGEFGAKYGILNRQGDCTEISALFVSLCRLYNIPARLVAGFKKQSNNWIRHAWAEIFYEGLWIPVDVVEGYVLGYLPGLIPLFRGNWMAENMAREFKISILSEFSSEIDLSSVKFEINFRVFSAIEAPIPIPKVDHMVTLVDVDVRSPETVKRGHQFNSELNFSNVRGKTVLLTYSKPLVKETSILQPKNVLSVKHVDFDKLRTHGSKIQIPLIAPNASNNYEFGYYIGSLYGKLVAWETNNIKIS